MSRHARENPELYEDPDYSYGNQLHRQADELRDRDDSPLTATGNTSGDSRPNQPSCAVSETNVKRDQGKDLCQ